MSEERNALRELWDLAISRSVASGVVQYVMVPRGTQWRSWLVLHYQGKSLIVSWECEIETGDLDGSNTRTVWGTTDDGDDWAVVVVEVPMRSVAETQACSG